MEPNFVDQVPNPISVPYLSSGTGYRIVWTPKGLGNFLNPKLCYLHYTESRDPSISNIPKSLLQFRLHIHEVTFQGLESCQPLSLKPAKRFRDPVSLACLRLHLTSLHLSTTWPMLPSDATSPGWLETDPQEPKHNSSGSQPS